MTDTPERTNVFYDAIDAFQRTHRLPGLQHAQLRGLLAEHLARVVPAAPAVVEPPADRAARRDLIEEYLRFLRGQGPEPDLSGLSAERCEEIAGQFKIVKALADRDPDLPPLDIDPVARRLGLHEQPAAVPPPAVVDPTADRIAEAALGAVEAALGDTLVPAARVEALAGIAAVLPAPADRAQERIWSEDGFTDEDQAALDSLRRMADETATTETARTPCSVPECDADGTGEPCTRHEREDAHAEGDHSGCGVECEAIIPTEHLRNMLLYRALPGAKGALAELERRAAAGARQDGAAS